MSLNVIPNWAPDVAQSILQTVLYKDPFTFNHCCRVGRSARRLGQAMGLDEFQQAVLEYSGLFHDIGKVAVPSDILLKPARLNKEEVAVMKSHPEKSVEILKPLLGHPFFRFLIPGVRFHHERVDGAGYPFNLKGEQIPLMARVIAVVDTVDAMMYTRPYREGMPFDLVRQELIDFSGSQFDANLVQIYLDNVKSMPHVEDESADEQVIAKILKVA